MDKDGRGLDCCIVAKWAGSMAVRAIFFWSSSSTRNRQLSRKAPIYTSTVLFWYVTHFWLVHVGTDGGRYAALFLFLFSSTKFFKNRGGCSTK